MVSQLPPFAHPRPTRRSARITRAVQPHARNLVKTHALRRIFALAAPVITSSTVSMTSSAGGSAGSGAREHAYFAGGCFWCVEAPYSALAGVDSAVSGYIGGHVRDPTYRQVCDGDTGHAEAVRVTFDPARVSFDSLLDVFFTVHDPTQLNRQGNDVGTQYRSAIFYDTPAQRAAADAKIAALVAKGKRVVTTVEPASAHVWYPAEEYHQCYVKRNPTQGYVAAVSIPKLNKVRAAFPELLKKPE